MSTMFDFGQGRFYQEESLFGGAHADSWKGKS
jgi:hypothetical protein